MSESLPPGWASASLGDLSSKKVIQAPPTDELTPYIDISAIDRSTKRVGEAKLVTARNAPSRARQWVRCGDVLVSLTRPNLNAVALVGAELDGAVASTGFDVLRTRGVVPDWIYYRVRTNEFVADVCEDLQGVVYPAIRPHDVRRHRLPVPPLQEQRRIVEAIESYFTRLDDAVASLERVQRDLKRYRAAVLKSAVKGRLVPGEAERARVSGRSYEPASVLLDRIRSERRSRWEEAELVKLRADGRVPKDEKWKARYSEPVAPDTSELPELPEGWCWTTLAAVAECLDHQRVPVSKKERAKRLGSVPYYGANGQTGWIDRPLFNEPLVLVVEDETFTGRTEPFSYLIEGPSWVNNHAHVLRAISPCSPKYLNYSLMFYPFIPLTTGTTARRKLTQKMLMSAPFPLAPIDEQGRIAEAVERHLSIWANTSADLATQRTHVACLRQSILKWAFEGRLVHQDPTDEPASTLLVRINAERLSKRDAQQDVSADDTRPRSSGRRKARTSNR